jgi:ABC-type oligopeptide transport system substrate-binding subunit
MWIGTLPLSVSTFCMNRNGQGMPRFFALARVTALVLLAIASHAPAIATAEPSHAIAMHGAPKYPPDFAQFDYVNPEAPKGGAFRLHAIGTFDTLNPYVIRGKPASSRANRQSGSTTGSDIISRP